MNECIKSSIDCNIIPYKINLTFHIELSNYTHSQIIQKTETDIRINWNYGNIPLIYLTSINGDYDTDEIYENNNEYTQFYLEIPHTKLSVNWTYNINHSIEELEKDLYYLCVPFNDRFGVYPENKIFLKYIHIKLCYDKTFIYKNNIITKILYRLTGIEHIFIQTDILSYCIKCKDEIFGNFTTCKSCLQNE